MALLLRVILVRIMKKIDTVAVPYPTAAVYTLGCKVNQYESEAITEALKARGFHIVPFHAAADVYIVNTCTVTAESDRKACQIIRRAALKSQGNACILVTGCMAQTQTERIAAIDGVTYVCGSRNKMTCVDRAVEYVQAQKRLDACLCKRINDMVEPCKIVLALDLFRLLPSALQANALDTKSFDQRPSPVKIPQVAVKALHAKAKLALLGGHRIKIDQVSDFLYVTIQNAFRILLLIRVHKKYPLM